MLPTQVNAQDHSLYSLPLQTMNQTPAAFKITNPGNVPLPMPKQSANQKGEEYQIPLQFANQAQPIYQMLPQSTNPEQINQHAVYQIANQAAYVYQKPVANQSQSEYQVAMQPVSQVITSIHQADPNKLKLCRTDSAMAASQAPVQNQAQVYQTAGSSYM